MTPQRRSRFFLSLRQLEQRLAAESRIKRSRPCDFEPDGSRDASAPPTFGGFLEDSASDSRLADASRPRLSNVEINDNVVSPQSEQPEWKSFCLSEGHTGVCGIVDIVGDERLSDSNFAALAQEHPQDAVQTEDTSVLKLERSRVQDNTTAQKSVRMSVENQGRHTSNGRIFDRRPRQESGIMSQTSILQMQSRRDGHFEQEFGSAISANSIDASDVADSGSPLVFPANWNPWEVGRNSNLSESNPPAIFLATPSSSCRVQMPERHCSESVLESQNHACVMNAADEQRDWLEEFSHLCALLDLNFDSLFGANKPAVATQEKDITLTCQHSSDAPAVQHEHPESLFYSNVAKVQNRNCLQTAEALDMWVERLSKSQLEPFCLTVFLIAKASLERSQGSIGTESLLTYPQLVEEWLTSFHTPIKE